MCQSRKNGMNYEELELGLLKKVINEVSHFRIKPRIHLSGGGEPTIHKGFLEIIQYCSQKKLTWSVTTNGFTMEKLYKDIIDHKCNHVTFSIHGKKDAHEKTVRVPGSFDKAISGIRLLDNYKKESSAKKPTVALNCVMNEHNVNDLPEILAFFNTLPINSVTFQHIIFSREEFDDPKSAVPRDIEVINKIKDFVKYVNSRHSGIKTVFLPSIKEEDIVPYYTNYDHPFGKTCVQPWLVMRINSDGSVPTCGNTAKLGNIRDNTIKEMWNGPGNISFRGLMKAVASKNLEMPEKCYRCCVRQY